MNSVFIESAGVSGTNVITFIYSLETVLLLSMK